MKKSKRIVIIILIVAIAAVALVTAAKVIRQKQTVQTSTMANTEIADEIGAETVLFGAYPQTLVTDHDLIQALNASALKWRSFPYDLENETDTGKEGFMRCADVAYDGAWYRAVIMDHYRDTASGDTSAAQLQRHGNYRLGIAYWFRFEPLRWRILDADRGVLLCERIVDAQPFCTGANTEALTGDYASSSIRTWLNHDFSDTAFSDAQREKLQMTTLTNKSYSSLSGDAGSAYPDGTPTQDVVTLLSYADAIHPTYGFAARYDADDHAREAKFTDYAVIQGLFLTNSQSYGEWMLRTPGKVVGDVCIVGRAPQQSDGGSSLSRKTVRDDTGDGFSFVSPYASTQSTDIGIRPVIFCPSWNHLTEADAQPQSRQTEPETESEATTEEANLHLDDFDFNFDIEVEITTASVQSTSTTTTTTAPATTTTTQSASTTRTTATTKPANTVKPTAAYPATTATSKNVFTLTVSGDKGVAAVQGGGAYHAGDPVTVSATTLFGCDFVGWTSSDPSLLPNGSKKTYTFTMPAGDVTLYAKTNAAAKTTSETTARSEAIENIPNADAVLALLTETQAG